MVDEKRAEEMKELFLTAESAMEAWAMLATSLGHPSFIKSEFEKICFLDNASTDTQVSFYSSAGSHFSCYISLTSIEWNMLPQP